MRTCGTRQNGSCECPMKTIVDSFGWIEYFSNGNLAGKYSAWIEKTAKEELFTPTIVLFEVYKKLKKEKGEEVALKFVAQISGHTNIIAIDDVMALGAAELSLARGLSMADALIKAAADKIGAKLVTSDQHFKNFRDVELVK